MELKQTIKHRLNKLSKPQVISLFILILLAAAVLWGPTIYANLSTRSLRYELTRMNIDEVPYNRVGMVFGAGVYPSGKLSPYLQWRIDTAVQLYKAHRVSKLLMAGDNSTEHYNEPEAMARAAEAQGVAKTDIVLDYAGRNTYDSCYRAQAIFKVQSATLVTQGYHLPRAVMACNALGMHAIGVNARHDIGRSWGLAYTVREWFSTDKIVLQQIFKPKPALLGPSLPIK